MQYPLVLVAAFATASIAAPAACPPASTQGKEDVAKEVGKLAEEACPPSQGIEIGRAGFSLPQDECKPLADKCLQGGITELPELKKCIINEFTQHKISENPTLSTKKPVKEVGSPAKEVGKPVEEVGKLAEDACPPSQTFDIDGIHFPLWPDKCKPMAYTCLQDGITELAELQKCVTNTYVSLVRRIIAMQSTQKPEEEVGKPEEEVGKPAKETCPPYQYITIGKSTLYLSQDNCKPLADKCLQDGITEPAELTKCITDMHASKIGISKNPAQSTEKPAKEVGQPAKEVGKLAEQACPPVQDIYMDRGYVLPQDKCKPLADKCLQGGITEERELFACIVNKYVSEVRPSKNPAQSTEKPAVTRKRPYNNKRSPVTGPLGYTG